MSKQKGTMAKGKMLDIKRETQPDRKGFVQKSGVHNVNNVHKLPPNAHDLQRTDTVDQTVAKRQNTKKIKCRQTVIRNLPQLQKLDNVPVSSEEMVSVKQPLVMMVKITVSWHERCRVVTTFRVMKHWDIEN